MVTAFAAEPKTFYAPVKGTIIRREDIPDATFASGLLGEGVGIEPEEGLVVAPFDGEIASTTDTGHAVGLTGADGMEALIHIGIDTVNMKGDGFETHVKMGDKVKAGQKLITFDMEKIKAAGYPSVAVILVANSVAFPEFTIVKEGKTNRLEKLFTI